MMSHKGEEGYIVRTFGRYYDYFNNGGNFIPCVSPGTGKRAARQLHEQYEADRFGNDAIFTGLRRLVSAVYIELAHDAARCFSAGHEVQCQE